MGGMGEQPGRGRGGRAEQEQVAVGFKTEKQKVHTGKGAIIGQLVFEGEQVPGEATSELSKTIAASEREASDLIHRDRLPRQYHKAVREYFSKAQKDLKNEKRNEPSSEKKSAEPAAPKDAEKPTGD